MQGGQSSYVDRYVAQDQISDKDWKIIRLLCCVLDDLESIFLNIEEDGMASTIGITSTLRLRQVKAHSLSTQEPGNCDLGQQ